CAGLDQKLPFRPTAQPKIPFHFHSTHADEERAARRRDARRRRRVFPPATTRHAKQQAGQPDRTRRDDATALTRPTRLGWLIPSRPRSLSLVSLRSPSRSSPSSTTIQARVNQTLTRQIHPSPLDLGLCSSAATAGRQNPTPLSPSPPAADAPGIQQCD
uniref:Uncharacterized protein n=1 Tax=Leersia perrieri TaxID=77586 RepID=A0A0D9WGF8_9ORYZ